MTMHARNMTKNDFDYIVSVLDSWFGGLSRGRVHPVFFYELGKHAFVAEDDNEVVGFLLGFLAPTEPPTAYVHFVGIKPDSQRKGVGSFLYDTFIRECVAAGAKQIKAIAPIGNTTSTQFHSALGFEVHEDRDYAGPGRGRQIFKKAL